MDETTARMIATQLARPEGDVGRQVAETMVKGNAALTSRALEALAAAPGETIVEVGPASGVLSVGLVLGLGPEGRYVAVEHSPEMAEVAERTLTAAAGAPVTVHAVGLDEAPLAGLGADAVLAVNVVYFAPDLDALARTFARWLRPGGRVVLGFRSDAVVAALPFTHHTFHVRPVDAVFRALARAGFGAIRAAYFDEGTSPLGEVDYAFDGVVVDARLG